MYFGGNRAGMKTILVKPLSEKKDYMVTKLLRGNEKKVLKEIFLKNIRNILMKKEKYGRKNYRNYIICYNNSTFSM